jgi:hypothetical protein
MKIANQIKKIEPQDVFFPIKDKAVMAVIGEKVSLEHKRTSSFFVYR